MRDRYIQKVENQKNKLRSSAKDQYRDKGRRSHRGGNKLHRSSDQHQDFGIQKGKHRMHLLGSTPGKGDLGMYYDGKQKNRHTPTSAMMMHMDR